MVKCLQKFKYPYPRDCKIIQMPYHRAKAIDQIPSLTYDTSRFWQFVYLYSPFLPETSVGLEECSASFNSSTASTRPLFQGQFDLPQHHNPSSPFYSAPARCLEPCECCDSVKQIFQNRLYGSIFPPAFPRIFKPRCVSSNMACVPVTSGLEAFAFPPQQSADLTVSVKADCD